MNTLASASATSSASSRGGMLCLFTNRGRVILISILILIPLVSYRKDILSAFAPFPPQEQSEELVSEAFNSYKLNSPLFEAVRSNDLELVRSLLEGGIDNNSKQKKTKTRTYYNVNAEDSKGLTPLIEATLLGNVELAELLLLHGARAQPSEGFRHTALRAACLTANTKLIKLLLEKGADPNAQSEGGRTPLMGACYLRPQFDMSPNRIDLSFEAVKVMLSDSRTDAKIKNDFGESALDLCRKRSYNKSMAFLRERIAGLA
mmetsp:Transcript_22174/g.47691  ORF Transcript_22174/g.47691 Transcript_22174/m.47691 type:complete len:261 (+) Transcript_22174:66-848(+)|eukprot:CAMPEP_0172553690 /NCGR_PEP_ID=MMETSP1067-20121228/51350_1 /TAXON_ID=265564 ORGANISM="Thalassiosira punctigera, Strain Tpunct2005C2" /NCGR_SAMPLE_ID=MMETSP1067 /ASSEMBLY_ACC=CAM_ASM_000444 /LENGTH=260 /DNA_ID=CAMNT_0013341909 /DNA_START=66 /DNA_END=848 /DNA_ORIENTATION=-